MLRLESLTWKTPAPCGAPSIDPCTLRYYGNDLYWEVAGLWGRLSVHPPQHCWLAGCIG